ncbi:MmcQ/YjbR family DNA-binding protein [Microlunatus sp. Gsoil 973]|uniref:MmcQ/YjbR family DNA-binding protein n=1 Tax=Microlunatus sp. Gsoil 973 TaxID=2672569 RepID=UPI001E3B232D|nr:MmcQ/YjbR family DNA-binding protein [Microlunatus sp. Gsoil 973]
MLVHTEDSTGTSASVIVLRAEPIEREALLSIGYPFFAPLGGPDRLGVVLTDETDWVEVRELLTESYRALAPKKLTAQLG